VDLLLSDGNPNYLPASVSHFGPSGLPRRQSRGPASKPRWMPLPGLLYAPVVVRMRRRRIVEVKCHVVFGTQVDVSGPGALRCRPTGRDERLKTHLEC
jgi:hypothetical protein